MKTKTRLKHTIEMVFSLSSRLIGAFSTLTSKVLYFKYINTYTFHNNKFSGKSILIIGPAIFAQDEVNVNELTDYDYIVRFNKSIDVPLQINGTAFYHHNILFHNFKSGSSIEKVNFPGEITLEKLKLNKTDVIIFPLGKVNLFGHFYTYLNSLRKRGVRTDIFFYPVDTYKKLKAMLNGYEPTSGMAAIYFFTTCNPKKIKVSGFSFFQTTYIPEYNNTITNAQEAKFHATKSGCHNPDNERLLTDQLSKLHSNLEFGITTKLHVRKRKSSETRY